MTEPEQPKPLPTVLLVEDHVDSRMMYAEFLGEAFTVLQAGDGEQAWQILQTTQPDAVVTDLSLPGVDGYELIRRIRSSETLRDLPVIALSGYAVDRAGREPAGWDVVFQKPTLPDHLLQAIDRLTSSRKTRG